MFRKAEKCKIKLRLGISGPSGSGKTWSSLHIAYGITQDWSKIALIDSEHGSGDLYADIGDYSILTLKPPFLISKYINAIKEAEKSNFEIVILDSITHAWSGEGGLLEQKTALDMVKGSNQYTNWARPSKDHQYFINAMLKTDIHLIATMRAKMEYILISTEKGKLKPEKVGLAPIQREGIEFEFTTFFDMNTSHKTLSTKDRTGLFTSEIPFEIGVDTGKLFKTWLEKGVDNSIDITKEQKQIIEKSLISLNISKDDFKLGLLKYNVKTLDDLSFNDANTIIDNLKKNN